MLVELRVENLLLIEEARLELAPGLNVITGETGAGKTMLAGALDLLLGGKARAGLVRPGASEAYVEGTLRLPDGLLEDPALAGLRELLPDGAQEVAVARKVNPEGRTRAYVEARSATAADLRELGTRLISFTGQHEHRRLMLASVQLATLDAFCGAEHLAARTELAAAYGRDRDLRAELDELREAAGNRERDLGLLEFEIAEIEEAAPSPEEESELVTERERLRHLEGLRTAALAGSEAVSPESGGPGASQLLAEAESQLGAVAGVDPQLDGYAERYRGVLYEAQELAGELRAYEAGLEGEPGRLEEVEERLDIFDRLKRKHGDSIEAVLEHAECCRAERDRLAGAEVALADVERRLADARAELERRAAALSQARRAAAEPLAAAVRSELGDLAMEGASFDVLVADRPAEDRYGPGGGDVVEFRIAPNPGVPAGALREVASGGELSRVMLAILSAAHGDTGASTLIFDEVDAGIGGATARAVGEKLRALAQPGGDDDTRQILCITHLPQVASLADRHFSIAKDSAGELATASVDRLGDGAVVGELCRMLGADPSDDGARRHAEELLAAA